MKYGCPIPGFTQTYEEGEELLPVYWVDVPDKWYFSHKQKQEEVNGGLPEWCGESLRSFCVALALADAYNLPGITTSNPDEWELDKLDLTLMTWVTNVVIRNYTGAQIIPKAWLLPWAGGQQENTTTQPTTDGDSNPTT